MHDSAPVILEKVIGNGGGGANLFLESSRHDRYRFRQRLSRGVVGVPDQAFRTRFLEGASVTAYLGEGVEVESAGDVSSAGCAAAASAAAGRLKKFGPERTPLPVKIPAVGAGSSILQPWPVRQPEPVVSEFARQLAEMCLGAVPDAADVVVEVAEDIRRIFIATTYDLTSSRSHRLASMSVTCRLSDGRMLRATHGGSEASPFPWSDAVIEEIRRQADARQASTGIIDDAVPVVLDAGWCAGTWLHEAIGHFFEADNILRGWGPFRTLGESVAPPFITILDDPTVRGGRGSFAFDDEGVAGGGTVLVEEGVVEGHLHSIGTAASTGMLSSGNGRRQDYRFRPAPRMTNLKLANGRESRETLLGGVQKGLLIHSMGGGDVDGSTGRFSFDVLLAEVVEAGRTGEPLTGLTLSGQVGSALSGIRAVGDDLIDDPGRGICLKSGQLVPVGLASPTLLLEGLAVGLRH